MTQLSNLTKNLFRNLSQLKTPVRLAVLERELFITNLAINKTLQTKSSLLLYISIIQLLVTYY